jgi:hypothetical protein
MEDKITALVDKYCSSMNEVCWYTSSYKWNRENLMDTTTYECGVKNKCEVQICKPCQSRKDDFHARLNMLIKLNKNKEERKWKKNSELEKD